MNITHIGYYNIYYKLVFFFRIEKCPEVQILDLKSRCPVNVLDCPTILPTGNF